MRDFGVSVLKQYKIDVKETKRVRGGMLVEASEGLFFLKEAKIRPERLDFISKLYRCIEEKGFACVDAIYPNEAGEYISNAEDETSYVLKRWFWGRECDLKKEAEMVLAAKTLAELHNKMVFEDLENDSEEERKELYQLYERHNRELRKICAFIQKRSVKNVFEAEFLQGYERMYAQAEHALEEMKEPVYREMYERAWSNHEIVHGDYNYHNILFSAQGPCIVGFERAHREIQLSDLYYYLRKLLEKHHYDKKIGDGIVNAYDSVKSIGTSEMKYLAIRLSYPEKFWKTANAYYHSNKAWVSEKNVEKLEISMTQFDEKKNFLKEVFGYQM